MDLLRTDLERDNRQARRSSGGRIEPAVRLAVTLRLLAGASYLDLVTNYNIAPATVYAIFHDTVGHLSNRIAMPNIPLQDAVELQRLAEGFQTSRSAPNPIFGCISALDGICVRVMKPHNEYIPRNAKDCTAFAVSGLGRRLRTVGLVPGFWIAGDSAYECRDGILTPWRQECTAISSQWRQA
eukprot:IDg1167t1